jgi:hypothetical protein
MATTATDRLLDRAIALARYQRAVRGAVGLLAAALAAAGGVALLVAIAALSGPVWVRLAMIGLTGAVVAASLVRTARQVLRSPPPDRVAALVERRFPDLQDRFVTAVEIAWSDRAPRRRWSPSATSSPTLAGALGREAEEAVRDRDLRGAIDTRRVRQLAVAVASATAALFASTFVLREAWSGLLTAPPPEPSRPQPAIMRSLRPPATGGPSLADISLRLDYPDYTGRAPETRRTDLEAVSALIGTRITLSARATGDRPGAELTLNGSTEPVAVNKGGDLSAGFVLRADVTWRLRVEDRSGRSMSTPTCRIKAVADQPPTVALTEPGQNLSLPRPRPVRLSYRAEDDWGISSARLEYRGPEDDAWRTIPLSPGAGRTASGSMDWDLSPLRLIAGQSVAYRVTARDNDTVSGPKTGRSSTYTITIGAQGEPSADHAPAREAVAEEAEDLETLEEEAEELGRQLDDLINRLASEQMTNEERARRSAELAETRRRLAEYADRVSRAFAESERQASKDREVPPEIRDRLQELHDLLQEAMNRDLTETLEQIEEALKALDPEELRDALDQAREAQDSFAARLDQAIELLKRLRLEQEIARAADRAERLAEEQQSLNEQRSNLQPSQADAARAQARQQQALKQQEAALESDLKSLEQQAQEVDQAASEELSSVAQQLQQSGAQQAMQEAASRLQQGQPSSAADPQNQALSALCDAAASLRQLQAQMTGQSGAQLARAAQELTRDALYLSREQETVLQATTDLDALTARSASRGKSQRESLRRVQEGLEGSTRELGEKLRSLSQQTPVVDPSLAERAAQTADRMAQAARETAGGAGPQAAASQREAMMGLNQLAEELIRLNENMQQAAQGMAMQQLMQQLQGLAQQQRGLNQQTQQRTGQGSEPRPRGSTGDLAEDQRRIKEALQKLLQRAGKPSGLPDQLGDVPADMEDVEQQLAGGRLGRQTLDQQRDILHRMLDAQRSVYKKDEQRRRRTAERPKPFRLPPSPPELRPRKAPPAGPQMTASEDASLPLDFEDIVREYFRALAEMP